MSTISNADFKYVTDHLTATGTEAKVCADIAKRQAHGLKKYGVSVADNPLKFKPWLQHAYEEALDFAVYLRRATDELESTGPVVATGHAEKIIDAYREDNARLCKELERVRVLIREQTQQSKQTIELLSEQLMQGGLTPPKNRVVTKAAGMNLWTIFLDDAKVVLADGIEQRDALVKGIELCLNQFERSVHVINQEPLTWEIHVNGVWIATVKSREEAGLMFHVLMNRVPLGKDGKDVSDKSFPKQPVWEQATCVNKEAGKGKDTPSPSSPANPGSSI